MRVLGIDYGARRVGLAIGDTESRIASAWGIITWDDQLTLLAKIHDVLKRDLVELIVIGIPRPLRQSGNENDQVREIRTFVEALSGLGCRVVEQDETMSSQLAARYTQEMGEKGKRDDLAAVAILQTWLDKNANGLSS